MTQAQATVIEEAPGYAARDLTRGEALWVLRRRAGLRQCDLGVSKVSVIKWEHDRGWSPRAQSWLDSLLGEHQRAA